MRNPRTKKTFSKYMNFIAEGFLEKCNLCDKKKTKSIKEFKYWRIIKNQFPYDRITKINHLIVLKRHVISAKLNKKEREELEKIKIDYMVGNYDYTLESLKKSIPDHFHLHLMIFK